MNRHFILTLKSFKVDNFFGECINVKFNIPAVGFASFLDKDKKILAIYNMDQILKIESKEGEEMEYKYKEVYFNEYCSKCKEVDTSPDKDPCNECLSNPTNENSHKPVYFKENDRSVK